MSDTKTDKAAENRGRWHRHPALIAGIPAVTALIGSVLTIVLGQAGALPATINPAPAQATVSTTQTVTATATTTTTVTETPTIQPTGTPGTPVPPAGELAITIMMGRGGRIGPDEYRSGSAPGANADVYDETGRLLDRGCYTTWVLKRGAAVIRTSRTGACRGGGFTMFNFGSDSLRTPGGYSLTVSALTDGGLKGTTTLDFKVT